MRKFRIKGLMALPREAGSSGRGMLREEICKVEEHWEKAKLNLQRCP